MRPDPTSRPNLELKVLVPSNLEELLYAVPPVDPGLTFDFTYVIMTWDDFLTLAQYMEEVKFKFKEYVRIVDYWEEGNEPEQDNSDDEE